MHRIRIQRHVAAAGLALALVPLGCGDDPAGTDTTPRGTVVIAFRHVAGNEDLELHAMRFTSPTGKPFEVTKLLYYVSNVTLHGPDGTFTVAGPFRIDAADPGTWDVELQGVPEDHYHDIAFTFGLDEAMNVDGALPNTQDNLEMLWPTTWGGGYHYMKLEGHYRDAGGTQQNFATHTGRFVDPADASRHPHAFEVEVSPHFNAIRNITKTFVIAMDVNEWYQNPNTIDFDTQQSIMDDTAMQDLLEANGASVFRLETPPEEPPGKADF